MDDIDRLLAAADTLSPSAGFASGVMDAIAAAAAEPPPRPFPWARFTVGAGTCGVAAAGAVWLVGTAGAGVLPRLDTVWAALASARPQFEIAAATLFATFATLAAWRVRRGAVPPFVSGRIRRAPVDP